MSTRVSCDSAIRRFCNELRVFEYRGLGITAVKEFRSQKSGAKHEESGAQESKSPEVQKVKVRSQKLGIRSQESGVRSQESFDWRQGDRYQMSSVRGLESKVEWFHLATHF